MATVNEVQETSTVLEGKTIECIYCRGLDQQVSRKTGESLTTSKSTSLMSQKAQLMSRFENH